MTYILVGLAGSLGAILRYLIGFAFFQDQVFPYATLSINWIGSFLLSKWIHGDWKIKLSAEIKTAIGTGFIGAFTTFSTFSVETVELFENGLYTLGLLYIFLSLLGGLWMAHIGSIGKKEEKAK